MEQDFNKAREYFERSSKLKCGKAYFYLGIMYKNGQGIAKNYNESNAYQASGTDCWICFDFKKRTIKMTSYSIKSYKDGPNNCHFKNWKIEVSNDCKNWEKIDGHTNCPTLNGDRITGTFDVKENDQTGKPWTSDNLWFYYLEFYGYIDEEN